MDIYLIISFLIFNSFIIILFKKKIKEIKKFNLIFVDLELKNNTNPYFNQANKIKYYDLNQKLLINKYYYDLIKNCNLLFDDNICIVVKNNFYKNHIKHKLKKILNKKIIIISIENIAKMIIPPDLVQNNYNYNNLIYYLNVQENDYDMIELYNNLINILFENNYYYNKVKNITNLFNIKDKNLIYHPNLLNLILKY